jgi:hypothetical protein
MNKEACQAFILMALVSNDILQESDVIVCLEGDGYSRAEESATLLRQKWAKRIVVSGAENNPPFSIPARDLAKFLLKKGISPQRIILEEKSTNTREQALEVMKLVREKNWQRIILVASHFHQPRAYLTFLKAMSELNLKIRIFNAPARNVPWFGKTPVGPRIKLMQDDFEKIGTYRKRGHVATIEEAIQYQRWKERKGREN